VEEKEVSYSSPAPGRVPAILVACGRVMAAGEEGGREGRLHPHLNPLRHPGGTRYPSRLRAGHCMGEANLLPGILSKAMIVPAILVACERVKALARRTGIPDFLITWVILFLTLSTNNNKPFCFLLFNQCWYFMILDCFGEVSGASQRRDSIKRFTNEIEWNLLYI